MTKIQQIFFGILIGLVTGFVIGGVAASPIAEGIPSVLLMVLYFILIMVSIAVYTGEITFKRSIKTTTNDGWSEEDHIKWIFNRLKHIHNEKFTLTVDYKDLSIADLQWAFDSLKDKYNENIHYDYMIRLSDIINKKK
jgi:hypothetical protein